jgi:hypothetical protein
MAEHENGNNIYSISHNSALVNIINNPTQKPIHKQHLYSFSRKGKRDIVNFLNDSNIEPYFNIKQIPIATVQ